MKLEDFSISYTIKEAIKCYKLQTTKLNNSTDITNVKAVRDDQIPEDYDVLILDVK